MSWSSTTFGCSLLPLYFNKSDMSADTQVYTRLIDSLITNGVYRAINHAVVVLDDLLNRIAVSEVDRNAAAAKRTTVSVT